MTIRMDKLNYKNFKEEDCICYVVSMETRDEKMDNFDRTFIVLKNDFEIIWDDFLSKIKENEILINKKYANLNEIIEIVGIDYSEHIVITARTSKYWEDVRYFSSKYESSPYWDENYNICAMQMQMNNFIRNKFYNKERLVEACEQNNQQEVMEILEQSKFTHEELKQTLEMNPEVANTFNKYKLHELLNATLEDNDQLSKKSKI